MTITSTLGGMDLMRSLTFRGFLTQYVKELSQEDTLSLKTLAREAENGNHRLAAPLVLYALATDKGASLLRSLGASAAADEMRRDMQAFSETDVEQLLSSGKAPREYMKVWQAFMVAKNAPERDKALKEAIRKKVLQMMQNGNCTNYRIYTDLKLNPGNVNSWLKNGDSSKVSYQNAERIMNYVMQQC